MENITVLTPLKEPIVFELEGFNISQSSGPLLFTLVLFYYIMTVVSNGVLACVIVIDKSLHRPMFVMICHLIVCDLLGVTAVLPRIMVHFLTGHKKIAYMVAITQAFCVHMYGAAVQTVLGVMAYDRYVAVCDPLRYPAIMTSTRLHSCCALAWFAALLCIGVLFAFHVNVPLCGNFIRHIYCSNRTILKLACSPTPINNIYGLSMTWCLSTSVFLIISFSYFKILHVSIKLGRGANTIHSKAFRTCASHIVVYLLYELSSLILIMSHRFPSVSQNMKNFFSIFFMIVPPAINPVIYGLINKELCASIRKTLNLWFQLKNRF